MMSVSVAGIQKNRCQTTIAEPIGETLAELPVPGRSVCLGRDEAAPEAERFQLSRELQAGLARRVVKLDPRHALVPQLSCLTGTDWIGYNPQSRLRA